MAKQAAGDTQTIYSYPFTRSFMYKGLEYTYRGKTQKEADKKANANRRALENGINIRQHRKDRQVEEFGPETQVKDYAEFWLKTYIKPAVRADYAEKTDGSMLQEEMDMYESHLRLHILPAVGNMTMGEIRDYHLVAILTKLAKDNKSESTIRKVRWTINKMFSQAQRSRIITYNPGERLNLPAIHVQRKERDALDDATREAVLIVSSRNPYGTVVRFALSTGMRNSEIEALKVGDIDLIKGIIHVQRASKGTSRVEGPTKSAKGDRYIPILQDIREDLTRLCEGRNPEDYLFTFPNKSGNRVKMNEGYMQRSWTKFRAEVLVELGAPVDDTGRITALKYDDRNRIRVPKSGKLNEWEQRWKKLEFYCLRHTYRTELQTAEVQEDIAARILGHGKGVSIGYTHKNETVALIAGRKVDELRTAVEEKS